MQERKYEATVRTPSTGSAILVPHYVGPLARVVKGGSSTPSSTRGDWRRGTILGVKTVVVAGDIATFKREHA